VVGTKSETALPPLGSAGDTVGAQAARVCTRAETWQGDAAGARQDEVAGAGAVETGSSRRWTRDQHAPRGDAVLKLPDWLTIEDIKVGQAVDSCIPHVMSILETGNIPPKVRHTPSRDLQCLSRQLDSLTIENGILCRNFVDTQMAVKYKQSSPNG
jgi:hypothetical protein